MIDPTAHIERVEVDVGEPFPLGWNDKVLIAKPHGGTTVILYILRRTQ